MNMRYTMNRKYLIIIGTLVAVVHYLVFRRLWGEAFALAENHLPVSRILAGAVAILSFPGIIFTKYVFPADFLERWRWWGDASNFIRGFAIFNAIIWGAVVAMITEKLRARRPSKAAPRHG
jgi:hypothetical protein